MWSFELLLTAQVLGLFIGLRLLYWVIFKAIPWHSPLMQALTVRIRLWTYVLILLVPVVWLISELRHAPQEYIRVSEHIFQVAQYALRIVAVVLLIEACSGLVFDWLLVARRHTEVPQILRSLARGVVYTLLFFLVLPQMFGVRDVAGLITSSAILSLILGLALQETLGNLFAGIAMQMSRPYQVGHWVKIGSYEGIVERADWRAMSIRTRQDDYVSFPHSFLGKIEIHNYSSPSPLHACEIQVGVHYRHPPYEVEEILLRCVRETAGVQTQLAPLIRLSAYQDSAILYTIKFWITDFARYLDIESDVFKRVWYQFKRHDIQIPFPIRDVYYHRGDVRTTVTAENVHILKDIEFLKVLSENQARELAGRLKTQVYARGETICRQGETGDTFYIIKAGQIEVSARNGQGQIAFRKTLEAGNFFGEISLLTGAPRSATVTAVADTTVLTMGKEDMRCMLEENGQLADYMSQVLAQRQSQLDEQSALQGQGPGHDGEVAKRQVESLRREILGRISQFFSY